jgi:hypothetical protein
MVISWAIGTKPDAGLANTMLDAALETIADSDVRAAHQAFVGYHRKSEGQKVDAIAAAIGHLLDGLIATRFQIGSVSGQVTSK